MRLLFSNVLRQKKLFLIISLLSMGIGVTSCHKSENKEEIKFETKLESQAPPEIFIPPIIWDLLEEKKIINSKGKIENLIQESRRFEENVFVGITVQLIEKTPGILGGKNLKFISQQSGGLHIDLAHYLKSKKGTFLFSFEPLSKMDNVSAQVLFLSDSVSRSESQSLGSGCGKFYDITKTYFKKLKDQGIEVNVTNGRHVSFLAGSFLMRVSHETGVRALTQLTLTDSNYPEFLCERTTNIEK